MAHAAHLLTKHGYDSRTVMDAAEDPLARVEAATQAVASIGARLRSNKLVIKALKA